MTLIASAPIAIGTATDGFTQVWSINDADDVAGGTAAGAAVWSNGQTTPLPNWTGDDLGFATAVGPQGQVVGYTNTGTTAYDSVIWQNGVATLIPSLGGGGRPFDISSQGVIVGSVKDSDGLAVASEIQNGVVTLLPNLPGGYQNVNNLAVSRAFSINDQGQIVGIAMTAGGVEHAVLWQNGSVTDLGSIAGGAESFAYSINDSGEIAGFAVDPNTIDQAVVWKNGVMTVLPDNQSNGNSIAYSVNNAGIIVGRSDIQTSFGFWQEDAVVWENGKLIDLNSFLPAGSGWVLNVAQSINNNNEITGMGTFNGVTTAFVMSVGDTTTPTVSVAAALQSFQTSPHSQALSVLDSLANIQGNLDALEGIASAAKLLSIECSDSSTPTLTVSVQQWMSDAALFGAMPSDYDLHVTGVTYANGFGTLQQYHVTEVGIADTFSTIEQNLGTLQLWASEGHLASITFTDAGPHMLTLNYGQVENSQQALLDIQSAYSLQITDVTVAQALSVRSTFPMASITILDGIDSAASAASQLQAGTGSYTLLLKGSEADLAAHLDTLLGLSWTNSSSLQVTDSNSPTLSMTIAEDSEAASGFLDALNGNMVLSIDASQQANLTIHGAPHVSTVVSFAAPAVDYSLSSSGTILTVTDVGTGRVSADTIDTVAALQFADRTVFVVDPPSGSNITNGNVAELYAAVLARTPDLQGVAFYQNTVTANPNLPLVQLAEYFLNSPEYQNNPAHAYAQSAAGDAQFITDTYQNLLHRAPDAGAVTFYQNVISQFTSGLTTGTAVYEAAQEQGHAQVLVYFSASQEFLNDVQITAQHPADAAHWLYLT